MSLSIICIVADPSAMTPLTGVLNANPIISSSSSKESSIIDTETVLLVSPAANINVPDTGA